MILAQNKIRLLIRESLRRILFESEDELDRLKAEFDRKVKELGNARSFEEFNQLNAEVAQLESQIQRTSKTLYAEPPEESEWDVFASDPIQPVVPYDQQEIVQGSPEDAIDITKGDPTMSRRAFGKNLVGLAGTLAVGKQLGHAYDFLAGADPRLKIAAKWFDKSFADGSWSRMYGQSVKNWTTNTHQNFDNITLDEQQDVISDYITDYSPEAMYESLITEFEKSGYQDPYEHDEKTVYKQLDNLIDSKLREYYTQARINQIRGISSSSNLVPRAKMLEIISEIDELMYDQLQHVEHAPYDSYQIVLEPLAAQLAQEPEFKAVFGKYSPETIIDSYYENIVKVDYPNLPKEGVGSIEWVKNRNKSVPHSVDNIIRTIGNEASVK